jgi:hypothetical protein
VRVEYKIDEGFKRIGYIDRVFFLKSDFSVTGYAPADRVKFNGITTGDRAQREAIEFIGRGTK